VKSKVVLIGVVALVASFAARGQSPDSSASVVEPKFGTSVTSLLTLQAVSFQLVSGTEGVVDETASRSCASDTPCLWLAGVALPSGSRITELELEACDSDPASKVSLGLRRHPVPMQGGVPIVIGAGTGIAATPGCALFPVTLDHTVDNLNESYTVEVSSAPGVDVRFGAVRVGYQLQVSAPPPVATFLDVPTSDPFFQFVEALAASRITSGCGGGNFCPNEPVTRGQMAVFLARALGLSFQN
jgi:hypothetical protein